MNPRLIIGLGNTLAGDDGIGARLVQLLASDPRLPKDVDLLLGGTDLLRHADALERRRQVLVLDAALDGRGPGTVTFHREAYSSQLARPENAHHISAIQALATLRALRAPTEFPHVLLMTISIGSVRIGTELSAELARRLPELLDRILDELTRGEMVAK